MLAATKSSAAAACFLKSRRYRPNPLTRPLLVDADVVDLCADDAGFEDGVIEIPFFADELSLTCTGAGGCFFACWLLAVVFTSTLQLGVCVMYMYVLGWMHVFIRRMHSRPPSASVPQGVHCSALCTGNPSFQLQRAHSVHRQASW